MEYLFCLVHFCLVLVVLANLPHHQSHHLDQDQNLLLPNIIPTHCILHIAKHILQEGGKDSVDNLFNDPGDDGHLTAEDEALEEAEHE